LKLLLDEQYSRQIAKQLRERGYDVEAVQAGPLQGCDDELLLRRAREQRRALLTNNVQDFAPIARTWAAGNEDHSGLIFTSDQSMPRGRSTIGIYIDRLSDLMDAHPEDDALKNRVHWL